MVAMGRTQRWPPALCWEDLLPIHQPPDWISNPAKTASSLQYSDRGLTMENAMIMCGSNELSLAVGQLPFVVRSGKGPFFESLQRVVLPHHARDAHQRQGQEGEGVQCEGKT